MRIVMEQAGFEYSVPAKRPVRTPEDAARACSQIAAAECESFCCIFLNAKMGMISSEVITLGILDQAIIHPREVFRRAVMNNAAAVVLVHNHPSGDVNPSAEDIRITRRLVDAGVVVGIPVLDHCIVGHGPDGLRWRSMREDCVVTFKQNEGINS